MTPLKINGRNLKKKHLQRKIIETKTSIFVLHVQICRVYPSKSPFSSIIKFPAKMHEEACLALIDVLHHILPQ